MQNQEVNLVFGATLQGSTLKVVRQVFRNMSVDDVIFEVNQEGMKLTVEEGQTIQESLYIPKDWCVNYFVRDDHPLTQGPIIFAVDLGSFTNCLLMTKDYDCQLMMMFSGDENPFLLDFSGFSEAGIRIESELKIKTYVQPIKFQQDNIPMTKNTIKMSGNNFTNLINDIDVGSDEVEIELSTEDPHCILRATGRVHVEAIIQVKKTSKAFRSFICPYTIKERFRTSHIRTASKCISLAQEVRLHLYTTGLLTIEILIDKHQAQQQESLQRTSNTTVYIPPAEDAMVRIKYFITPTINVDE
ncbi:hypothetical protein DMENIID0001_065100 [Sergentomyia squamirostris]